MTGKCKLCGWNGYTQMHHIIPTYDYGSDEDENLIELCPNHHSEARYERLDVEWFHLHR